VPPDRDSFPYAAGKVCRKCRQMKGVNEFHADKHFRDGRRPVCRACEDPRRKTRKGKRKFEDLRLAGEISRR